MPRSLEAATNAHALFRCALFCASCSVSVWSVLCPVFALLITYIRGAVIGVMTCHGLRRLIGTRYFVVIYLLQFVVQPAPVQSTHTDPVCWCDLRLFSVQDTTRIYVCRVFFYQTKIIFDNKWVHHHVTNILDYISIQNWFSSKIYPRYEYL